MDNAELVPGRDSAWERHAGGSPTTAKGSEAERDAKGKLQSSAAARTSASASCSVCGVSVLRRSILASLEHTAVLHSTSASALGHSSLPNIRVGEVSWTRSFVPVWFWEDPQFSTKVM